MKFLIVFVALFAMAVAFPSDAVIDEQKTEVKPNGYSFSASTSDGTTRQEQGYLKDENTDHASLSVSGSVTWKDEKTGQQFTLNYVADENGFQPTGAHIPVVDNGKH